VYIASDTIISINIAAFITLSFLSLVQVFIFARKAYFSGVIKYLVVIVPLIHSICFTSLLMSFQQIGSWRYMLVTSCIFFVINILLVLFFYKNLTVKSFRKVFYIDILAPGIIILFLGIIPFFMNDHDLFNTFNRMRDHQTYEQYLTGDEPNNSDQIPSF